jgi:transposase
MAGARLSDGEWQRIWACLKDHPGIYVGQEAPTRLFLDALLWMARAGAPWRLLPEEFGPWNSVYKRFARWEGKGVWQILMDRLSAAGDLEWRMLDSTVVRAHACAAGAKKPKVTSTSGVHGAGSPASCTAPRGVRGPHSPASPTASATRCGSP